LDLSWVYTELAPYYSEIGRPSIAPVLMIRMLIIGYVFAIRSERQICREVQVNLAYRWFCDLGLEDAIPDHSAFSRARNERFRESDIFRQVFERVVETCIEAGLVGGEGFAVDANLIFDEISRALLRGERVELRGFGAFAAKRREARVARNPRTGAHVDVAEKHVLFFKTGKQLRERLNQTN